MGTKLPDNFELKEDGTPYLSGTEWEYFNALKGSNRVSTNNPLNIWAYRRNGSPQFAADDPELPCVVSAVTWSRPPVSRKKPAVPTVRCVLTLLQ